MELITHKITDPELDKEEPCCSNPNFVTNQEGFQVCASCGTVFDFNFVGYERRAFTKSEVEERIHTSPRWRDFGPRTDISDLKRDGKGNMLTAGKKMQFRRLAKIHSSLVDGIERNFWTAKPQLKTMAERLNLPRYVYETAWRIYQFVPRMKLTLGRSIQDFLAASLYASIRVHNFPRVFEDITSITNHSSRRIHQALAILVRKVLPQLGLKYVPIPMELIICRFGNLLDLSVIAQKRAIDLYKKAMRNGLQKTGKDPKGIAAAAIYLAVKDSDAPRTQADICVIARVTEVTLRYQAKKISAAIDDAL